MSGKPSCRNLLINTEQRLTGKSTYIRSVALMVIMAQIGCL